MGKNALILCEIRMNSFNFQRIELERVERELSSYFYFIEKLIFIVMRLVFDIGYENIILQM